MIDFAVRKYLKGWRRQWDSTQHKFKIHSKTAKIDSSQLRCSHSENTATKLNEVR